MIIVRTISTVIKNTFRIIKTKFADNLVNNSEQIGPFGFDSNPPENSIAIISETMSNGKNVVIGYINKNALDSLNVGDSMIFSTDNSGSKKSKIILRNDGTVELIGNSDNAIRYIPLDLALQNEVALINAELTKIAAVLNSLIPGSYSPTPIQIDISASKIEEIKTN